MITNTQAQEAIERIRRLVKAATGDEYGDGSIVTDYGIGVSEPGYGDEETPYILGNWNDDKYLSKYEIKPIKNAGSRLAEALEARVDNVMLGWLDEWIICDECFQAFRSQGDSYSWRMYGVITEDGYVICGNCLVFDDIEEDYVNNPLKALTLDLELPEDFERFNGTFHNGWYSGQNDQPEEIMARALEDWEEAIFTIPSVGQFDIDFELWVRSPISREERGVRNNGTHRQHRRARQPR